MYNINAFLWITVPVFYAKLLEICKIDSYDLVNMKKTFACFVAAFGDFVHHL